MPTHTQVELQGTPVAAIQVLDKRLSYNSLSKKISVVPGRVRTDNLASWVLSIGSEPLILMRLGGKHKSRSLRGFAGYGYFIGFQIAMAHVDYVVKASSAFENAQDIFSYVTRMLFCFVCFYYILQRKRFKHNKTTFHEFLKKCLEVVLILSTAFIIIFKAFGYFKEICKILMDKHNFESCLVMENKTYKYSEANLTKSQHPWVETHTTFLKPIILVLNQELFPILSVILLFELLL